MEEPIETCDAIFVGYSKTRSKTDGDKIKITLLLDASEDHNKLAAMPLGEILHLYLTKQDLGA